MKLIKTLGQIMGWLRALPHLLCYGLMAVLVGRPRAFCYACERIARIPGLMGIYTRQAFLRMTTAGVGRDVHPGFMSLFSKPGVRLGNRVYVGRFCSIGWVDIGDDVMLADGVQILSGRHQHGTAGDDDQPMHEQPQVFERIVIGRGAWLGAGSVIMADVGDHAIVAAGAVVVKPVPAGERVGGVPAQLLSPDKASDSSKVQ